MPCLGSHGTKPEILNYKQKEYVMFSAYTLDAVTKSIGKPKFLFQTPCLNLKSVINK